ncbi:hypothetical protein ANAEL_01689 [Anaerolineales bacterium]|nr:hypothetical protein ANAEL_01689 [Anaerolineales bacterium]
MRLNQISASDQLTQTVVTAMMSSSVVLEHAEFYPMVGSAEYRKKSATGAGGAFRALDNNFSGVTVSPTYANPALKIFGDLVRVDRAHERRGGNLISERARQLVAFAKNMGKNFTDMFFNGDVDTSANQFDGLLAIVPSGQVITAADNGFSIVLGNDNTAKKSQQEFLELLDKLIQAVQGGAQVLYMNELVLARLSAIARDAVKFEMNQFGQQVAYYNGIPVRNPGLNSSSARILPQTETQGTSSGNCSSIYAVRFGEAVDLTLSTNVGLEVKDLGLVANFYTHAVELDTTLALLDDTSVARLKGLKLG